MKLIKYITFIAISLTLIQPNLYALSAIRQCDKDYRFTFGILREMEPMMINFQTDDRKKDQEKLKKNFEEATFEFFGQNYDGSSAKYYNLKLEMVRILGQLCTEYINRSKEILTTAATENKVVDIFMNYSKSGSYYAYFKKPFDPLNDISPYREDFPVQDFHFFLDLRHVENYMRYGHYHHFEAKRIFNDPELAFFKSKKKIPQMELDYIIERYIYVIRHCRYAKQLGIEIYKLKNKFTPIYYQDKYNLRKSQFTPIFDDRIPEKFIIDAVDNAKLIYPEELARKNKIAEKVNKQ
ncbi:MAG: hypothetical protein FWF73_03795 [Spirochaetes bacterium]|nr:hypothetical protein [Spirochaetota bacterium]